MSTEQKSAVVLLSGGLDSATALAAAQRDGFRCHALTIAYGQRHAVELQAAARVAQALGAVEHRVMHLDLRAFGGSALTADIAVPTGRSEQEMASSIPVTYVPARNTIFLALALAYAEVSRAFDIYLGINAVDYSVSGDSKVWIRCPRWTNLMPIEEAYLLPGDDYETVAVNPENLHLEWRRVTGRYRHVAAGKRCFQVTLERGQTITITEDHSLFTIDPDSAKLHTVRGDQLVPGMPLVVPFDLSEIASAFNEELPSLDLTGVPAEMAPLFERHSIHIDNGHITNRLGKTRIPIQFPVTDSFLYIVGLWLAEGGKEPGAMNGTLAFSVGGIPGAVDALQGFFFEQYGIRVIKSPANQFDYHVSSSVMGALFRHLGLYQTAKSGKKAFPPFFWRLSQRQRRLILAGLWDGDGSHVFNGEATLAQKSHRLIDDAYHCLTLDGIFPTLKKGRHEQKKLILNRAKDFQRFPSLYPLRHPSKRASLLTQAKVRGKDKTTGLWKCLGLWNAVSSVSLPAGGKTRIYNAGGKYDVSVRSQRSAFAEVPSLRSLVDSRLAFLRIREITETSAQYMYDLSVEGAENFLANGILAHNSGYPDCRPEFVQAFEALANLATKAGVEGGRFHVHAPLVHLTKADIIRLGVSLGVDYALTHSCYDPTPAGLACGRCDSCVLRRAGFAAAGVADPTRYAP